MFEYLNMLRYKLTHIFKRFKMSVSNNVVEFPNSPSPNIQLPQETTEDNVKRKQDHVQKIVDELVVTALRKFYEHGYDVKDLDFINDFTFSVETLKAVLYRRWDLDHALHPIMDKAIEELNKVSGDYKK